mgnify:CR=1 FL=1
MAEEQEIGDEDSDDGSNINRYPDSESKDDEGEVRQLFHE